MATTTAGAKVINDEEVVHEGSEVAGGGATESSGRLDVIRRIIVVAVDESAHSDQAMHWAIKNILNPQTDLCVLLNVRPAFSHSGSMSSSVYVDFQEFVVTAEQQARVDAHTLLKEHIRTLKSNHITCKAIALRGDARAEIIKKTDELRADLLIMGSRGLSPVKRALMGSVSDYCVRNAKCPVIIYKTTDEPQPPQPLSKPVSVPSGAFALPSSSPAAALASFTH